MWWPQTRKPSRRCRGSRSHEAVAEDALAREARDDLAHDAHRRQHHDVDRRVRVEPEQVLEEERIAAERRIEDADLEHALDRDQHQRHREHRRRQHQDDARRVDRPDEERQPEPASCPARACVCTVTMKLSPVRIDEKPDDEHAGQRQRPRACWRTSSRTACRTSSRCRRRRATARSDLNSPPARRGTSSARFSRGNARSRAPIISGIRKLPSIAGIDGIRKNHTMITPCSGEELVVGVGADEVAVPAWRARGGSASRRRRRRRRKR